LLDAPGVSILARPFDRTLPALGRPDHVVGAVSILARPFDRTLPGGRCQVVAARWFQSSPGLSTGRYARAQLDAEQCLTVSILARPFDRTLLGDAAVLSGALGFQSSPGLSTGRYVVAARGR